MTLINSSVPVSFLYVTDRDRALLFCEQLGLALRGSDDFGDFMETGGGLIRMTVMPDHIASPHPVLGWEVSDILATAQELSERGIGLTIYEGMGQDELGVWTSPDGKAKVAWFTDPDGNVLSLSQA
ncbi:hypothetical protein BZG35_08275 [Brevundimonas sp. LM2]|uniref:VOC family protein n=1 Tax=Brevundimonas sp. LM2 TaxID=1938605 RepID=UPI000983AA94|nr:hypothetical protein [Brevundimonas sp. LM2]AQR61647.1 hypothetical protein BZG35_08275 [Brevundimonas sp. LM2]